MTTLKETLRRIAHAKLTLRPSIASFACTDRVDFLGQDVGQGIRTPLWEGVEKVRSASKTSTKREVGSFLGLASFFRDSCTSNGSLRKANPTNLNGEKLKRKLIQLTEKAVLERSILCLPDHSKPFILRTDASDVGMGAVLLQERGVVVSRWQMQAKRCPRGKEIFDYGEGMRAIVSVDSVGHFARFPARIYS